MKPASTAGESVLRPSISHANHRDTGGRKPAVPPRSRPAQHASVLISRASTRLDGGNHKSGNQYVPARKLAPQE